MPRLGLISEAIPVTFLSTLHFAHPHVHMLCILFLVFLLTLFRSPHSPTLCLKAGSVHLPTQPTSYLEQSLGSNISCASASIYRPISSSHFMFSDNTTPPLEVRQDEIFPFP